MIDIDVLLHHQSIADHSHRAECVEMAVAPHSRPQVVYEIVDIPPGCELNKLREFCSRLAQDHIPSLKTASDKLDEENGDDSNENIAQKEENGVAVIDGRNTLEEFEQISFYNEVAPSGEGLVFQLENQHLHSKILFENIFENMTIKTRSSSTEQEDSSVRKSSELAITEPSSDSRGKLTRRRIRKSFIYD